MSASKQQVQDAVRQEKARLWSLRDGLHNPVPVGLKAVFEGRNGTLAMLDEIERLAMTIGSYKAYPCGEKLNVAAIEAKVGEIRALVTPMLPFVPCRCSTRPTEECPECHNLGWLTLPEFLNSPQSRVPSSP